MNINIHLISQYKKYKKIIFIQSSHQPPTPHQPGDTFGSARFPAAVEGRGRADGDPKSMQSPINRVSVAGH